MTKSKCKKKFCLCKAISPTFILVRLFGLLPISTSHDEDNVCMFKKSTPMMLYSASICALYAWICFTFLQRIFKGTDILPVTLSLGIKFIYSGLVVVIISMNLFRVDGFISLLNNVAKLAKERQLLCPPSMKGLFRILMRHLFLFIGQLLLQFSVFLSLNFIDDYDTDWQYTSLITHLIQNSAFLFYTFFGSICAFFISIMGCFTKTMRGVLDHQSVHPMPGFEASAVSRQYMCCEIEICSEPHELYEEKLGLDKAVTIESMRCFHEKLYSVINTANDAMGPQILVQVAVELAVLIMHWYSVIIFFKYDDSSPAMSTNNLFNWIFLVLHSLGLLAFLKTSQELENLRKSLVDYLLEYSTRTSNLEELQQLRLFITKLRKKQNLSASGVFAVNLSVAAPMAGNILTYVLVALQFRVPSKNIIN